MHTDTEFFSVKAVDFAARAHKSQRRKDVRQTPYINHPIGVARILIEKGHIHDPVTLAAAYLHVCHLLRIAI